MDKQRRNKSFSRKAISRRNLKKIKSHFNLLLRQPNISIPNDYLEPLPAKLPRIEKKLDNDTENNNDKPSTSHHNIIDQSVVDNTIHNRESIYSRVGNSRKTDDNVNNANYDNHQNLIFQNRSDDNENVDARLDNCVVTNNSLPFNVSINFNSNIFITPNINTTIKDHLLSVVALSLRHHLSYDAILDIFRCMNMLYGTVELPTTKQALWRALGRNDAQITKYFYCRQCEDFLGEKSSDSNKLQQLCCCGACGPTKSKAQEASSSADNVSVETRNYIKKVLKIPVMNDDIHSQPKIYGQGKSIIRLPTFKESLALISAGFSPETITYYKKMTINKVKYSCQNDEADVKYCDSVIYDGKGRYGIIQSIIMFNHGNLSVRGLLMLIYDEEGGAFQTQHIKRVKISENLVFVHENCRIKPACLMKSSDKTYVVKLSNCWETD
ncbi:hypothetical protein KQX54_009068 [Cotesia glomerata]|uniref:Uncharacterized protein n=1 Tax=Cotesia glomerata TaxID=32391 RepID=A0AAV7HYI7_COTGL|nr:hypothetical protein KQX54_009068 [Cotesia glomerata]